jgi:hypothetical protein
VPSASEHTCLAQAGQLHARALSWRDSSPYRAAHHHGSSLCWRAPFLHQPANAERHAGGKLYAYCSLPEPWGGSCVRPAVGAAVTRFKHRNPPNRPCTPKSIPYFPGPGRVQPENRIRRRKTKQIQRTRSVATHTCRTCPLPNPVAPGGATHTNVETIMWATRRTRAVPPGTRGSRGNPVGRCLVLQKATYDFIGTPTDPPHYMSSCVPQSGTSK